MKPRLSDAEIRRMFDIAYEHARDTFGYFAKPKLVIMKGRDKTDGDFYYIQGGEIYVNSQTRDPMYESLKHELVHAYLDHVDTRHQGIFTELCRKVGGIYCGRRKLAA